MNTASAIETTHEERREEIKTYRVRSYHVGCGGEWLNQGMAYSDNFGTRVLHRCDKCTALENFHRSFPEIIHE